MGSIGFSFRNITYRRPEEALFASDAVCMDSPEVLQPFFLCEPPEQVRLFITLFCVSVAFSLIINHPAAISYYRFVANANLPQSGRRGLGYNACKAYGIFPIGHLPESHFQMVGWLLVVSLLLACHSHLAPRFFLFASFGLYFLYFGQLFLRVQAWWSWCTFVTFGAAPVGIKWRAFGLSMEPRLHQIVSGRHLFCRCSVESCGGWGLWPAMAGQYNASIYRGCYVEPPTFLLPGASFAVLHNSALVSLHLLGFVRANL